jgi:hypothetical protein
MFSLNSNGGSSRTTSQAEHEFHQDQATGPLHGELFDLCGAVLVIVPLAFALKAFLF